MAEFAEVPAVPDWGMYKQNEESLFKEDNSLVCLANRLHLKDSNDLSYFTYLTNNFDLLKPETYKKTIASDLAEEWANTIKQEMDSFIKYET